MPSAASYSRREAAQLAKLVFFLDHQIGRYVVAEALRGAGAKVESGCRADGAANVFDLARWDVQ